MLTRNTYLRKFLQVHDQSNHVLEPRATTNTGTQCHTSHTNEKGVTPRDQPATHAMPTVPLFSLRRILSHWAMTAITCTMRASRPRAKLLPVTASRSWQTLLGISYAVWSLAASAQSLQMVTLVCWTSGWQASSMKLAAQIECRRRRAVRQSRQH